MIPYFAIHHATTALFVSIGITAVILVIFGYLKCAWAGCGRRQSFWGAVQTLCIGAAAAGASYGIVRAVDSSKIT
jgi:VIT1/CCC1 family predicted Fe2+/Mn2+ transporter